MNTHQTAVPCGDVSSRRALSLSDLRDHPHRHQSVCHHRCPDSRVIAQKRPVSRLDQAFLDSVMFELKPTDSNRSYISPTVCFSFPLTQLIQTPGPSITLLLQSGVPSYQSMKGRSGKIAREYKLLVGIYAFYLRHSTCDQTLAFLWCSTIQWR